MNANDINILDENDIFIRNNYPEFTKNKGKFVPNPYKPCVCLSGKNFKYCCYNKIQEAKIKFPTLKEKNDELDKVYNQKRDKKLISFKLVYQSITKKQIHYCACQNVLKDCTPEEKIDEINKVYAHTLAKESVLNKLVENENEELYYFNDHRMENNCKYQDIDNYYSKAHTDNASGVIAFCKHHDDFMFSEIEKGHQFEKKQIQNLEYALKAISFNVYYYVMSIHYMANLIKDCPLAAVNNGGDDYYEDYQSSLDLMFKLYYLQEKVVRDIADLKEGNSPKNKLNTVILEFPENVKKINFSLAEYMEFQEKDCFVNAVNLDKPYIIISSYNNIKEKDFIDNKSSIDGYIPLIEDLLYGSQNVFFNKKIYESLTQNQKFELYEFHRKKIKTLDKKIVKKLLEISIKG